MPTPINPLEQLDDVALFNTQLALALLCQRSKSALKKHGHTRVCALSTILRVEADRRGRQSPSSPYRSGDIA